MVEDSADMRHDIRIEAILKPLDPCPPKLNAADAFAIFAANPGLTAIPLVENGEPVGLVERHIFLTLYAGLYRRELYARRPVGQMVDTATVIIDCAASIHEAVRLIADRRPDQINVGFVATRDGKYAGVGFLMDLMRAVADLNSLRAEEAERAQIALSAAQHAADAANRAKSDFLSRMSHELRTPLNAVIGFSQMLLLDRRDALTAKQKEYCQDIESSGRHLLSLVNDVLDLARIESGNEEVRVERVATADVLKALRGASASLASGAGIALAIADPAGIPDVHADERRLHQVLLNLVSNAIKYNRTGGSVSVTVSRTDGGKVRFSVADIGIGIPVHLQSEIFEPFHRLGQEYSGIHGTGIGLSICRRLCEAMGGSIGFVSEPNQGSTFWVEMPGDVPVDVDAAPGRSMLYVEDNPANMRLMTHLISTLPGIRLLTAANPEAGLDLAEAHRPDVIVLDMNLPGMTGFEVLERLKAMPGLDEVPVLALTADATSVEVQRGLAAGFRGFLAKPIDVKAFLGALAECVPLSSGDEGHRIGS